MTAVPSLAPLLERFFTQRLMQQRQVSPHTNCRPTLRRSSVYWPSLASALRARSSASSRVRKSMLCSPPPTATPGSGDAIMRLS